MSTPNVTDSSYMKVRFTNGRERSFAFESIAAKVDATILVSHVQKSLDSRRLVLQMKQEIVIIPFDNIESIEVSAAAEGVLLPEAIQILHEFN
jgi:hypothetical protein